MLGSRAWEKHHLGEVLNVAESWFLCGEAVFSSGPGDEGRRPLLPPGPE